MIKQQLSPRARELWEEARETCFERYGPAGVQEGTMIAFLFERVAALEARNEEQDDYEQNEHR